MRALILVGATLLLAISCSPASTPTAAHTAVPSPSPRATASPSASPSALPRAATYGLLIVDSATGRRLEMITPDGRVGASAPIGLPALQTCIPGLRASLQPPVSATSDRIYYRDGDTKIRYLTPTGESGDATTVPGNTTTISFFSVSPDDTRIAVLVEDFAGAGTIALRLYVEDVTGGGHHLDIYKSTTPKSAFATTLWPMGWHNSQLVLAQVKGCTNDPNSFSPSEWHLASATTGTRTATIRVSGVLANCILSFWPSAHGVACVDQTRAAIAGWNGTYGSPFVVPSADWPKLESAISPNGDEILFATGRGGVCDGACPVYFTAVTSSTGDRYGNLDGVSPACLWIDDGHLLTPDAVLTVGSNQLMRKALPASGVCAGRFPGGL